MLLIALWQNARGKQAAAVIKVCDGDARDTVIKIIAADGYQKVISVIWQEHLPTLSTAARIREESQKEGRKNDHGAPSSGCDRLLQFSSLG